jgi:hypothetical protein
MKKPTKKRGTPRRAPKKARARTASTALARRPATVEVLPPAPPAPLEARTITEGMVLGELGLAEIKFTPEEEQVLGRPVDPAKCLVKPDGAVYYSHTEYTRWLNEALGRGAWMLVPVGLPALQNKSVVCPYVLFIHGKPAALAQGEQDFFESNRNQSYGDALESTVASALRRCCKRLGIGLELWDRAWTRAWLEEHALEVYVTEKDGKQVRRWRRRIDPPLPFEVGARGGRRQSAPEPPPEDYAPRGERQAAPPAEEPRRPATHTDARGDELITQKQRQRLFVIGTNAGRSEEEVAAFLKRKYRVASSKEIRRRDYERICELLEAPGDLP